MLVVMTMTVVGGALVLGIVFLMVAAENRRTDMEVVRLTAELRVWAQRTGWMADEAPPPVLATGGIDEVRAGEHRRLTLTGTLEGRTAAMTWCTYSDTDATHRYAALLVELAPVDFHPTLRVRQRYGLAVWRRDRLKVVQGQVTVPVHQALDRLRAAVDWFDELVRIEGRVLRVVIGGWPGPAMVDATLRATAEVLTAIGESDSQNRPSR